MEMAVLKSFSKYTENDKVIYSEVNLEMVYKGLVLYPEYKKWLEDNGFN